MFIKRQTSGTLSDIQWQQVTTNENMWYNKWQRVTTNDIEWYNEWQRVTTSGTAANKEWQREAKNNNEW